MVYIDFKKDYARYNNILYENGIPIIKFINGNFCDLGPNTVMRKYINEQGMKYMQRYINMFPQNCIVIKQQNVFEGTIFEIIINKQNEKIPNKEILL